MRYKILWIDDQHDIQQGFLAEAYQHKIDIVPFKTSVAGMRELEMNIFDYDGVILDAKVYENSENEVASLGGLSASVSKINQLQAKKVIPYFVFTGQSELKDDATFKDMTRSKIFFKGADNGPLFEEIKREAEKTSETQIRHRYARVFEVCTEKYLGKQAGDNLLKILKSETDSLDFGENSGFNDLRQILELLFRCANRYGLLHDKCLPNGMVNLTASYRFLSQFPDYALGIECRKKHFSQIVSNNVKYILDITNIASHTEDKEAAENCIRLNDYLQITRSPYLFFCLTYQIMDILLWFKDYVEKNSDIELNRALWADVEDSILHRGKIARDESRNYHCGDYLLPYTRIHNKFIVGDIIIIRKASKNEDTRTNSYYSQFSNDFEKVEVSNND